MITTTEQYHQAQEELRQLEERLHRLQQSNPLGAKGFTKAGIRKMIARLHEELTVYEGARRHINGPITKDFMLLPSQGSLLFTAGSPTAARERF